jgi:class 3 adenylate cyclase/tetratricopeptide (TPR) repeat protein
VISCPSCGAENPLGAKFCIECGSFLGERCSRCGVTLPPGAKFCPSCGAPVDRAVPARTQAGEERRIVTILFVDLVGFTERSDRADPEDVRRRLVPFHGRVKHDLERFGGTLDKFIGDAVMGVFGAPVAHEDDPLRAVRSAMAILESMGELRREDPELEVRVAVHTGEAVVSFGTGPQIGEAVAGDVVNTTSRMQALAPTGSVVVGESTARAVADRFDLEKLPAAAVKGKSEPIQVWRVRAERAAAAVPIASTSFVGREQELELLHGLLQRVERTGSVQTVTLIGDPGIGKSRLLMEFHRIAGDAEWLAGACLPYGEAVTFAPVADTIRTLAAIEPADDPERARGKLEALVSSLEPATTEREWLTSGLAPLLGIDRSENGSTIPVRETAQAWSRVVAARATELTVILVLEDLHWAEPVLIDLIEALADLLGRKRVLLLCTARPELLERHDRWGAGRADASTVVIPRLSGAETASLLTELLAHAALPDPEQASLIERSGGNPLYALEFARMLGEHGGGMKMPETVQAMIAARLDSIPTDMRSIVQDAAVVGTAFWPGVLEALGARSEEDIREGLEWLGRRGLVHASPASAYPGQTEHTFRHALIAEVAYGRMPRSERARRHLIAAGWIESASRDRAEERAETLARHYATAVELAVASGQTGLVGEGREPAVRWSLTAAERATRLDAAGAFALFDRAVALAPEGSQQRARALTGSARMGRRSGSLEPAEVLRRYTEVLEDARAAVDPAAEGVALINVGSQLGAMGETARAREALALAVERLEAGPPGPDLARAYAYRAEEEMFAGRVDQAIPLADRAIELAPGTSDDVVVMSLHIRGDCRSALGDAGGLDDLRRAYALAERSGRADDIVTSLSYLAEWEGAIEGPAAAVRRYDAALEITDRRGVVSQGLYARCARTSVLFSMGAWNESLAELDEVLAIGRDRLDVTLFAVAQTTRSKILLLRGRRDEVLGAEELVALARPVEDLQALAPALAAAAQISLATGDAAAAAAFVREFEEVTRDVAAQYREWQLPEVVRCAIEVGEVDLAERLVDQSSGLVERDRLNVAAASAALAERRGELAKAAVGYGAVAEAFRSFPNPLEEAIARLGRSRCLEASGRADDARNDRKRADELLAQLGVPAV